MMRAREIGGLKPCVHCGAKTIFERVFLGARGAQHKEVCCAACGPEKDAESRSGFAA